MTLHTVYIGNMYEGRNHSYRIGTTEIRHGNDSSAFNSVNSVVWSALYDGGFFPIGTTSNGRFLTLRRIYILSWDSAYNLSEVRAYQVPNLL